MRTRAAVMYDMGKLQPYAETNPLVVEELELDPPGPGEVLVEIAGAGLCHSDLSTINGTVPRKMPTVLGHEASGIVREVGQGVKDFKPDDHVVFSFVPVCGHCLYCSIGRPALCEHGSHSNMNSTLLSGGVRMHRTDGQDVLHFLGVSAFSQYTVAAQESLIKIDPSVPLDKAALFGCAVITGVGAVINTAKVEAGEPVVIFGLGGVGLSALLGAKLAGAWPVVVVDTIQSKLDTAKKLGADFTINPREIDPLPAIRDYTRGGAEYAFEAVGNPMVLSQAFRVTRKGGKTISIGIPDPKQQLNLSALALVSQEKTLMGSFMGSAIPRRDIPRLINLYMAGQLPVDQLFSQHVTLEGLNEGFDRLASGAAIRQVLQFS